MNSAMTLSNQTLSPSLSPSISEVPLNAQLENLRELARSLLAQLDSLGRAPKPPQRMPLKDAVQRFEMDLISAALEKTRGNQSRAARLLGVKNTTLNAKLRRYGIQYPDQKNPSAPAPERSLTQ